MEQDSTKQDFWNHRYAAGKTPWDYQGVPKHLQTYLANTSPGKVLIPGCGSGYEVAAFHETGWSVTAIDFSHVAVERAKKILRPLGDSVLLGDFFQHPFNAASFDLVYERKFLCALPPTMRYQYAERMRQLIRSGGKLAGFFLVNDEVEPAPPHPISESESIELLGHHFMRTQDELSFDGLSFFEGKERWQEWTLKPCLV